MTKLNIKKITAAAVAAALTVSFTGCGENTTWGAVIDGNRIPAGIFIYYLQEAYYDAQMKLSENAPEGEETATETEAETEAPNLFESRFDGKNAKDWIYDEATKSMQEFAAVESKFDEYGLTISDEDKEAASIYCQQLWDYAGDAYTEMGIAQSSYLSIYNNSSKRDALFHKLYSEGGEYAVPEEDIKAHLTENYAMINYIDIELKDGEGNLLKSDGKEERRKMAEEYIDRYKKGEDFDSLNAEYVTFYDNLKAEAAAAAAENEDTTGEGDELGGIVTQVVPSDAQASLLGEGDLLTESEGAEAANTSVTTPEDEPDSDASAPDEAEAEAEAEAETETEPEPESDSETAPVPEESAAVTAPAPNNGETVEELHSEDDGHDHSNDDVSVNAVSSNQVVVTHDSDTPDANVIDAALNDMNNGDIEIIESADGEHFYVVLKMDILETDEYYESAKDSLLFEMKSEDYDALIEQWTSAQTIERNGEAYKRYDPEKIFD